MFNVVMLCLIMKDALDTESSFHIHQFLHLEKLETEADTRSVL